MKLIEIKVDADKERPSRGWVFCIAWNRAQAVRLKLFVMVVRDFMVTDSAIVTGRLRASKRRKRERVEPVIRASSDSCGNRGRCFSDRAACCAAAGMRYGRGSGKRVPPMAGDIEDPGRTEDGGYLGRLVI